MPAVVANLKELIEIAVDQAAEAEDDAELALWRVWQDVTAERVDDDTLRVTIGCRSYRIAVSEEPS